jgi:hypothetical protein
MQLTGSAKLVPKPRKMKPSFTQPTWSEELKKSSRPRQAASRETRESKPSKRKSKEN